MGYLKKYGLVGLLIFSLTLNLISYLKLEDAMEKIDESDKLTSLHVERSIRQSMGYTNDFIANQSQESMQNLQKTIQELSVSFKHWVDINQTERRPNKRMQQGLRSIETMGNLVAYHLNNQYIANNNQLSEYDIELLEKVYENLDRLLIVYHNIKDRIPELKYSSKSDGGLGQVSGNIEEMARLYRHSILPNKHPDYISIQEATEIAPREVPKLKNYKLLEVQENPLIKDGVHYYHLDYGNKDVECIVTVDAINKTIRSFEYKNEATENKNSNLSRIGAIEIAQEYLKQFHLEEVVEEMFEMKVEEKNHMVYAFRFTPIINNVKIVSDAISINISSETGGIIKYSRDFVGSSLPTYNIVHKADELMESKKEELGTIEYEGLSLIRSFQTRYKPRVAHVIRTTKNEQQMLVFFDVETGNLIYQLYDIYEPIN